MPLLTYHEFPANLRPYLKRTARRDCEIAAFIEAYRDGRHTAFTLWQAVLKGATPFTIERLLDKYWRATHEAPGCAYQQGFESMLTAVLKHGPNERGQRSHFAFAFIEEWKRREDAAK